MTHEQVDERMQSYMVQRARCDYLQNRITELERQLEAAANDQINDLISLTAKISDMPHGTDVSNPTERAAVKMADGYESDDVRYLKKSIATLQEYLRVTKKDVDYVDSWMTCLIAPASQIVMMRGIENRSWSECSKILENQYNVIYSTPGLKKIYRRSMNRIYAVAELDAGPHDTSEFSIFEPSNTKPQEEDQPEESSRTE